MATLKEILYEYAYTKGGGLPLSPEEMCNAVVQWVQKYVKDKEYVVELSNKDNLITLLKSVNANGGTNYDINIDISELGREVVLKPASVSEDSVPVVGSTGVVNYKPVSELGGGGGGGNIYLHRINMSDGEGFYFIYIYLSTETELTSLEQLKHYNFTRIPCSGVYETGSFVGSAEISLNGIKLYGIRINNNNPPDITGQNGTLITIISFNDFVTQM